MLGPFGRIVSLELSKVVEGGWKESGPEGTDGNGRVLEISRTSGRRYLYVNGGLFLIDPDWSIRRGPRNCAVTAAQDEGRRSGTGCQDGQNKRKLTPTDAAPDRQSGRLR